MTERDVVSEKQALLLVNLGSPAQPTARHVRRFLNEFLSDPRVVDVPKAVWNPLLKCVISPLRAPASAKKYRTVWFDDGSPLIIHTENLTAKVAELLPSHTVSMAMRYGQPSIRSKIAELVEAGVDHITVLPLFPQYSSTTTASVFDEVADALRGHRRVPVVTFVRDFAEDDAYLDALAASVQKFFDTSGKPDVLVLSYHGIPEHYATAGDDYPARCEATTAGLVARLGLSDDEYSHTYQSKFGPRAWLGPATIDHMAELAQRGVEHVQVVAPAFTADCLETLEELDQLNRETFLEAGGKKFAYIPALNDDDAFASAIARLAETTMAGTPEGAPATA